MFVKKSIKLRGRTAHLSIPPGGNAGRNLTDRILWNIINQLLYRQNAAELPAFHDFNGTEPHR